MDNNYIKEHSATVLDIYDQFNLSSFFSHYQGTEGYKILWGLTLILSLIIWVELVIETYKAVIKGEIK